MDQSKIFNSAQGMLEVSKEIESFDKSLSDICLFISDKLLKIVECCQPQNQPDSSKEKEVRIDGIMSFANAEEASRAGIQKDQICVGHGNISGSNRVEPNENIKGQSIAAGVASNDIEKDVQDLVTKIRSKMGKK